MHFWSIPLDFVDFLQKFGHFPSFFEGIFGGFRAIFPSFFLHFGFFLHYPKFRVGLHPAPPPTPLPKPIPPPHTPSTP
jgi:hypothetical protein